MSKSKYEYDLKKVEINPSRLESYLLYSLWKNLQNLVKTEQTTSTAQKFQLHTPPPIQNPPVFQTLPLVPSPPRPIFAARFSPLALPVVLHDLPLNYAQRISLYDGEGNVTAKYHVEKFDDFIDLE